MSGVQVACYLTGWVAVQRGMKWHIEEVLTAWTAIELLYYCSRLYSLENFLLSFLSAKHIRFQMCGMPKIRTSNICVLDTQRKGVPLLCEFKKYWHKLGRRRNFSNINLLDMKIFPEIFSCFEATPKISLTLSLDLSLC